MGSKPCTCLSFQLLLRDLPITPHTHVLLKLTVTVTMCITSQTRIDCQVTKKSYNVVQVIPNLNADSKNSATETDNTVWLL